MRNQNFNENFYEAEVLTDEIDGRSHLFSFAPNKRK